MKRVTEPSTVECRKESDVVFVVDSTSNLLEKDFQMYILGTIAEITQQLDVDSGRTRVAAVPFTITAKVPMIVRITKALCVSVHNYHVMNFADNKIYP